jgi:hypothetical protein
MLKIVPDGVRICLWRRHSLAMKWIIKLRVTRQNVFGGFTCDGVTKAVTYKMQETAKREITHDSVRIGSRQYDSIYSGELTASEFTLDAVRLKTLYIVFYFSFIRVQLWEENFGETLDEFHLIFKGFKHLFHPCLIEDKYSNNHSIYLCVVWFYLMLVFTLTC